MKSCQFCGTHPVITVRAGGFGMLGQLRVKGVIGCPSCGLKISWMWWNEEITEHIQVSAYLWEGNEINQKVREAAINEMRKVLVRLWQNEG